MTWSTWLGSSPLRCTSSMVAARARSSTSSRAKSEPALVNGVRQPATRAARGMRTTAFHGYKIKRTFGARGAYARPVRTRKYPELFPSAHERLEETLRICDQMWRDDQPPI